MNIKVEHLTDSNECDQCGGGYACGLRVFFDDQMVFEHVPIATCYGGNHLNEEAIEVVLGLLGHKFESVYK